MMAALFIIYILCLLLVGRSYHNTAFALVVVNLILCLFMLIHHTTNIFNIVR